MAKKKTYRNHLYVKLYEKIGGFPRDSTKDKGMPGTKRYYHRSILVISMEWRRFPYLCGKADSVLISGEVGLFVASVAGHATKNIKLILEEKTSCPRSRMTPKIPVPKVVSDY